MRFYPAVFGVYLLFSSCASSAGDTLFSATYKSKYSGWNFETTRTLTQLDAHTYVLEAKSNQVVADLTETSRFAFSDNRFTPLEYQYTLKALGIGRIEHLHFDHNQKIALSTSSKTKEGTARININNETLDPALYQLKLQWDFAQSKNAFTYEFVKRKDIKKYWFKKIQEESLGINQNTYATTVLERQDAGPNKSTKVWLLKDFPYLIARIQHQEKPGETYTIELKNFNVSQPQLTQFYQLPKAPPPWQAQAIA